MLHAAEVSDNVRWSGVCPFAYPLLLVISTNFYRLNYTWINHDRKSINLAAPTYIDYVMTWVQNLLDDENVFPTKSGASSASQRSKRL